MKTVAVLSQRLLHPSYFPGSVLFDFEVMRGTNSAFVLFLHIHLGFSLENATVGLPESARQRHIFSRLSTGFHAHSNAMAFLTVLGSRVASDQPSFQGTQSLLETTATAIASILVFCVADMASQLYASQVIARVGSAHDRLTAIPWQLQPDHGRQRTCLHP